MPQSSALPTYSAIYAFGDSLSDAGNLSLTTAVSGTTFPVSPPYFSERYGPVSANVFSNGPNFVQDLSIALGLGVLAPSLTGGTDFALGGGETGQEPQNAANPQFQALSLPAQLSEFQTRVPNPSANALYTLSVGANDLLDVLADPTLTPQQQTTDVNAAVANEIAFVTRLVTAGAKTFVVLNVPDLGKTPNVTSGKANGSNVPSAALDALATQLTDQFNTALDSQLATITGATVHVVDTTALLDNAIANPAVYGLTNVTTPVWSGNYTDPNSGTLAVTGAAAQNQFLFWDGLHPTESGHQVLADAAEAELSGTPVLTVQDTTTNQPLTVSGQPYTGPVAGLQQQYINITPDSLNITASTPNWFIHGGGGEDGIAVTSGNNVLDGGAGSSFLVGGSGSDTFFIDDRAETANIWSTVAGFHASDAVTIWGVTQAGFTLSWADGEGATGYTGLTLTGTQTGKPQIMLTLAGYSQADLTNGRLAVGFGGDIASGSNYMNIRAV
jgi:phospholipase/lecithinase/hemolysin